MSQSTKNTNKTNLEIADRTNQANMDIAQMSNEYNMMMLDKQIEQQWEMWQAENEYNSPAAQKQRYLEAGINPYMADMDAGSASSMTAPSAQAAVTPTMVGATMQADPPLEKFVAVMDTLANIASSVSGNYLAGTQIAGAKVSNYVAKESALSDIKLRRANADILGITAGNEKTRQNLNIAGQEIANESAYQQLLGHSMENMRAYTELQVLPQQLQYSLAHLSADLKQKYLNNELSRKEIERKIQEIRNIRLDNEYLSATMGDRIRQATAEANYAENNQNAANLYQVVQDFMRHFIFGESSDPDNLFGSARRKMFTNPFAVEGDPNGDTLRIGR